LRNYCANVARTKPELSMYHVVKLVDDAKNSPGFHSGKVEIPYTLGTRPLAP